MPGRHAASLLPKEEHSPALLKLLKSSLTDTIVEHVAQKAMGVLRCRDEPLNSSAESSTAPLPELDEFIRDICRKSRCHVPTLLCTLVYLDRLKERLPVRSCGSSSTRHRVFVAALIVAAKYLNDSSPYNKHWVRYAGHFRLEEVNLMERQLLCLLDFDLRIDEPELIETFAPFLGPIEAGMAERLLRRQSRPLHQHAEASDSDLDFDSDDDDTSEFEMDSDSDGGSHSSAPSSTISRSSSSLVAKTQEIQLTSSSANSESSYSPQAEHKDEEDDLLCGSSGGASRPVSWSSAGSVSTIASSLDYSCHEESSPSPTYSPPTTRHVFVIPKQPSAMTTGSDLMKHLQRKLDFQSWISSPGCGATSPKRNAILSSSRISP